MPPFLLAFRAAFTFLTRIPVGGFPYPPATWQWISIWFPVVGLVLGSMASLLFYILPHSLSFESRAILIVGFGLIITGGFHEDGLADTADALGGAYDKDRVLEILKDSRIGAFGGMALVIALALRVNLLADLEHKMMWGLILGQSLSRAASTMQLALFPYVRNPHAASKSKDVAVSGTLQFIMALFWSGCILMAAWYMGLSIASVMTLVISMGVMLYMLGHYFMRRAGGLTGDFLGSTQQITELTILFILVIQ